ncbi:helix-turn-helix transcriptional regulator [Chitinophaga sp. 22321]|uniref:Helix-turn-helix transcriptional regulator n=1 Tax=Chitinophaga hostae TaxID=2831022 RepID=A0ABS5J786_9BACT|nr:AraC family transcriptional regulator [Chitinophaga hostae]MBS0031084.1 helix-turn-helix transcriptional regulator [Chitinophaga hostae]
MLSNCQEGSENKVPVQEKTVRIGDPSGFHIELKELSIKNVDLRWGSYRNPSDKILSFLPGKKAIVSHFRMQDDTVNPTQALPEKQFVVYRESPEAFDMTVTATRNKKRSFFELIITEDFFADFFTAESKFLESFRHYTDVNTPSPAFTAHMTPGMYSVIGNMQQSPYSGHLKALYLEAKATELFLMQVKQLDEQHLPKQTTLQTKDIEALHDIRQYIEEHYGEALSLQQLAKRAGINQMKLKNGFKLLFNSTVFGYLGDIRMQEAKRLLQDEKMYVNEVADRIGYKHPHHFTAAFRKKFGMLPRDTRK